MDGPGIRRRRGRVDALAGLDSLDLRHLRRGGLPARGGPLVAYRRADPDHPHGITPHLLETSAGSCTLDARPGGPRRADRRSHRPSARVAAARSRRWIMDLACRTRALRLVEPAAVRSKSHGPGGLAFRVEPQPDRSWRTGYHGAAGPRLHDRHALPLLEFPGDRPLAMVLGLGRDGGTGLFVQVHHGTVSPAPGSGLVARQLVPIGLQRLAGPLPRHAARLPWEWPATFWCCLPPTSRSPDSPRCL